MCDGADETRNSERGLPCMRRPNVRTKFRIDGLGDGIECFVCRVRCLASHIHEFVACPL